MSTAFVLAPTTMVAFGYGIPTTLPKACVVLATKKKLRCWIKSSLMLPRKHAHSPNTSTGTTIQHRTQINTLSSCGMLPISATTKLSSLPRSAGVNCCAILATSGDTGARVLCYFIMQRSETICPAKAVLQWVFAAAADPIRSPHCTFQSFWRVENTSSVECSQRFDLITLIAVLPQTLDRHHCSGASRSARPTAAITRRHHAAHSQKFNTLRHQTSLLGGRNPHVERKHRRQRQPPGRTPADNIKSQKKSCFSSQKYCRMASARFARQSGIFAPKSPFEHLQFRQSCARLVEAVEVNRRNVGRMIDSMSAGV